MVVSMLVSLHSCAQSSVKVKGYKGVVQNPQALAKHIDSIQKILAKGLAKSKWKSLKRLSRIAKVARKVSGRRTVR